MSQIPRTINYDEHLFAVKNTLCDQFNTINPQNTNDIYSEFTFRNSMKKNLNRHLVIATGNWTISTNLTISKPVLSFATSITISSGVTVTFSGGFFSLTGLNPFANSSVQPIIYGINNISLDRTIIRVSALGGDFNTIQGAIDYSESEEIYPLILVSPGDYYENLVLTGYDHFGTFFFSNMYFKSDTHPPFDNTSNKETRIFGRHKINESVTATFENFSLNNDQNGFENDTEIFTGTSALLQPSLVLRKCYTNAGFSNTQGPYNLKYFGDFTKGLKTRLYNCSIELDNSYSGSGAGKETSFANISGNVYPYDIILENTYIRLSANTYEFEGYFYNGNNQSDFNCYKHTELSMHVEGVSKSIGIKIVGSKTMEFEDSKCNIEVDSQDATAIILEDTASAIIKNSLIDSYATAASKKAYVYETESGTTLVDNYNENKSLDGSIINGNHQKHSIETFDSTEAITAFYNRFLKSNSISFKDYYLFEDEIWNGFKSEWAIEDNTGSNTNTDGPGGLITLQTGAVANNKQSVDFDDNFGWNADENHCGAMFRIKLSQITDCKIDMGLISSDTQDYIKVIFDSSVDDKWRFIFAKNASASTAIVSSANADTNYIELKFFRVTSDQYNFLINNQLVGRANEPTKVPDENMQPFIRIETLAGSAKSLIVDSVKIWQFKT